MITNNDEVYNQKQKEVTKYKALAEIKDRKRYVLWKVC